MAMSELDDLIEFLETQSWVVRPIVPRVYDGDSILCVKTNINSVNVVLNMENQLKKRFIEKRERPRTSWHTPLICGKNGS